jgi:hypothetical protein
VLGEWHLSKQWSNLAKAIKSGLPLNNRIFTSK